jgi:hypothetical protein
LWDAGLAEAVGTFAALEIRFGTRGASENRDRSGFHRSHREIRPRRPISVEKAVDRRVTRTDGANRLSVEHIERREAARFATHRHVCSGHVPKENAIWAVPNTSMGRSKAEKGGAGGRGFRLRGADRVFTSFENAIRQKQLG